MRSPEPCADCSISPRTADASASGKPRGRSRLVAVGERKTRVADADDVRAVGLLAQLSSTRHQLFRTLRRAPQPLLHRGDEPPILVAQLRPTISRHDKKVSGWPGPGGREHGLPEASRPRSAPWTTAWPGLPHTSEDTAAEPALCRRESLQTATICLAAMRKNGDHWLTCYALLQDRAKRVFHVLRRKKRERRDSNPRPPA